MKAILMALAMCMIGGQAMACPGGGSKSLEVKGRAIAEIDMVNNRVKIVDKNSELTFIAFVPSKTEIAMVICGASGATSQICDYDQGLGTVKLTSDRNAELLVKALVDGKEVTFKATNFGIARAIGCGAVVEGT